MGLAGAAMASLAVGSVGARANLLVDGGFDNSLGVPAGGFYENYGPVAGDPNYGGVAFDNAWTISGNVDLVANLPAGWVPVSTPYSLDLNGNTNGNPPGAIAQTINTVEGQKYNLSFYYSNNSYASPQPSEATVTINGSSFNIFHAGATPPDMNWILYSGTFIASSNSTTLIFTETDANPCCNGGIALDSVNVSAIPEASTWAMLIVGFLGTGFVAYRRKSSPFRLA
jgi:hypothetical protein